MLISMWNTYASEGNSSKKKLYMSKKHTQCAHFLSLSLKKQFT